MQIAAGALAGALIGGGIYLAKAAITGEGSARGFAAAAAGGAVAGALAAATGGASLAAQGTVTAAAGAAHVTTGAALAGVAGGMTQRAIETGSLAAATDPRAMAWDAAAGVAGLGAAKVAATVIRKAAPAVKAALARAGQVLSRPGLAVGGRGVPEAGTLSNEATRHWYHAQLDSIPSRIDARLPIRERSLQAFAMRNEAKLRARALMADRAAAESLPPPSTLQEVVRRAYERGLRGDEVWRYVLDGSQRSNSSVDTALGITR
jgi:hypothetical protein